MNFKDTAAEKLEAFLEFEIQKEQPLTELPNGSIVFKNMIIRKNKQGLWTIRAKDTDIIKMFNLKSCAIAAAKHYHLNNYKKYFTIISLDSEYSKSATDAEFYKALCQNTKDAFLHDLYFARYSDSHAKAETAKRKITLSLKTVF